MPKQRARARVASEFNVSPWGTKAPEAADEAADAIFNVQYANLIPSGSSPAAAAQPSPADPRAPRSSGATDEGRPGEWVSTRKQHGSPASAVGHSGPIPMRAGTPDNGTAHEQAAVGGRADDDGDDDVTVPSGSTSEKEQGDDDEDDGPPSPSSSGSLTGICQLAWLPDGRVSGHIIVPERSTSYGVSGHALTQTEAECLYDDWIDILRLQIINFCTGAEAEAYVARSGGDLARMEPAEEWQLRTCDVPAGGKASVPAGDAADLMSGGGSAPHAAGRHAPPTDDAAGSGEVGGVAGDAGGVQVHFDADQLFEGEAAEAQLDKFAKSLKGRGALVNLGICRVRGLPAGFA